MPTDHAMSAADKCPPEIIAIVLRHLSDALDGHQLSFSLNPAEPSLVRKLRLEHYSNLTACALVNSKWCDEASRLLYANVLLSEPGQMPALVSRCASRLAGTRHLRIMWNRQPWILPEDPDLALLPDLMNMAPKLSYITLGGEQFNLHSPALIDAFRRRSYSDGLSRLAPILGLSCCSLDTHYIEQRFGPQGRRTSRTISHLLAACPDLTQGRFDEFRSAIQPGTNEFASLSLLDDPLREHATNGGAKKTKLTKLALKRVVLESNNLERLLCPLAGQLEELYLDRTSLSTCETWKTIVSLVGSRLRVLVLRDCDFWATWERSHSRSLVDSILHSCPNLCELTLSGSLDSRTPALDEPHANLRELTVASRYVTFECVWTAIVSGTWPSLRSLEIMPACAWSQEDKDDLCTACTSRSIICKT